MTRRSLLLSAAAAAAPKGLDDAAGLVRRATASGDVREAALLVSRQRKAELSIHPDRIFLLASITKPMTAAAAMLLVDRGQLRLEDAARKHLPEFTGGGRETITVRHLLTHTSGLPDMLPENIDLRRRHASLKDFVAATIKTPLLFKPGTETRYQSMGILLAAEIVERVTRQRLRDFLKKEIFDPLSMTRTALGLGRFRIEDTARCQTDESVDYHWNTPYWRDLGAPWGGAHSTPADVTRFLNAFLYPDGKVFKEATARRMIENQNPGLNEPWGIGWMVKPGRFGKHCSERTFGHYGSTGTVAWADPKTGVSCVLLTTKPADQSRAGLLGPVSDAVSAAVSS